MKGEKGKLYGGLILLVGFLAILGAVFSPIFRGQNALEYLDSLYNSISKSSAYYIPAVAKDVEKEGGQAVSARLNMVGPHQAEQTAKLFALGGAQTAVNGSILTISGDLDEILKNALADSEAMYHNKGEQVSGKYGYSENLVLYNWWNALKEMDKDLGKQKRFKAAKLVTLVQNKAVEPAYNYYKIEPQKISDSLGIVVFSLLFYVLYTLWYGFAVMYLFEGSGLKLGH